MVFSRKTGWAAGTALVMILLIFAARYASLRWKQYIERNRINEAIVKTSMPSNVKRGMRPAAAAKRYHVQDFPSPEEMRPHPSWRGSLQQQKPIRPLRVVFEADELVPSPDEEKE